MSELGPAHVEGSFEADAANSQASAETVDNLVRAEAEQQAAVPEVIPGDARHAVDAPEQPQATPAAEYTNFQQLDQHYREASQAYLDKSASEAEAPPAEAAEVPAGEVEQQALKGGFSPLDKDYSYTPPPEKPLIAQKYQGSCVPTCGAMVLADNGIQASQEDVAAAAGIDPETQRPRLDLMEGGRTADLIEAVKKLGGPEGQSTQLTVDDLRMMTNDGCTIVVGLEGGDVGHAVIVDGVDANRVYMRDPGDGEGGESYSVTIPVFRQAWDTWGVIFPPKARS